MQSTHAYDPAERASARRTTGARPGPTADAAGSSHPVLALQRQIGNAGVARVLAQRSAAPAGLEEDEADERAAVVQPSRDAAGAPAIGPEGGPVSDALAGRIQASRGAGAPLDVATRATMEERFGTSFADVRVHTGGESDALNRHLGARAFTSGPDVYFRGDAGPGDRALLAHELAHVVQQRAMPDVGGPLHVGPAGDAHEQQAEAAAAAVAGGGAAPAAAQRHVDES